MANVYDIGDGVRLTAAFDIDGSGANPTTVTVTLEDPSGNQTNPASGSGTNGTYNVDTIVDEQGTWYYHFAGTGAVVAAGEGHFFVRKKETA